MKTLMSLVALTIFCKTIAQPKFEEIDLPNGSSFLLGEIVQAQLETASYQSWFKANYQNYAVDKEMVALFSDALAQHEILLFLGTWCGDSKREVPRMLKVLKAANFPTEKLKIVAVDRRKENYKKGLNGEEEGWNIKRVPTLILTKNGKEVNRIVERPIASIEEDLFAILKQLNYTPNYSN